MKNRNITSTTILLALGLLAQWPAPKAFGVVPAPDGGYPGGNTAEGQNALLSRTTGIYNTAVGIFSLLSLTDGDFNTGVGAGTLLTNTGDENTATGAGALLSNTTGGLNTANGAFALFKNTTGFGNTATGFQALLSNTEGVQNTADGLNALGSNTIGTSNTGLGFSALLHNTEGGENTAVGAAALFSNVGNQGTGEGIGNTATGAGALLSNTTGFANTADGHFALSGNISGSGNVALGSDALSANTTGGSNTAIGAGALHGNTTGHANVAVGDTAGGNTTTGSFNIHIANFGEAADSDTIRIGNVQTSTFIAGIFGQSVDIGTADAVLIDADGKLGTVLSSRRFKHNIEPMDKASEAILALKPVTFHYKSDTTNRAQVGLIAEEVAEVNPDLAVRDKNGEIMSVRYDQINVMLLNEFLKEHRKVEEQGCKLESQGDVIQAQQATIAELKEKLETVIARQKDQDAQIEKVNAQLETSKPAQQVVLNNP
jgi:Chaperone of endosialidase